MRRALGGAVAVGALAAVAVVASNTFAGAGPSDECLARASTYFSHDIVTGTASADVAVAGDSSMVALIDCGTTMVDRTPRLPLLDGVHPVGRTDVIGDEFRDAIVFYPPVEAGFATLEGLAEPVRMPPNDGTVTTECVTSPSPTVAPVTCGYFAVFDWVVTLDSGTTITADDGQVTADVIDVSADAGHVVVFDRAVVGEKLTIRIGVNFGEAAAVGIRLDGVDPTTVDISEIVVRPAPG